METIIFNNFAQYSIDFVVLCGNTEIWDAKESNGAHFDLSRYCDRDLMIYHRECEKYKDLKRLGKSKNCRVYLNKKLQNSKKRPWNF
ncbi:hypothetical protein B9Z55_007788 [Caenorhabditis nigoni]|uniref:Uncharacterized protein n=1 Tax=Caenorhabditis nigoni TaxID=1611254 RepID=A0A2G5VBK7_9PELO|nr:hypothetical protein B9Z55_007788 [Caenorhabditis nigoni]